MFSQDSIDSIDRSISYELLKVLILSKVCDICMEDDIEGTTENSVFILVMSVLTDSIRQLPSIASPAIRCFLKFSLRFFYVVMDTDIDESLLFKVLLVDITN